jgi:uncharacterized phage infection (PIP) family protein YhgE
MSSMAKIFVVVNLVLAVATFGSAAVLLGAQDDYRKALEDTKTQFDGYKTQMERDLRAAEDRATSQQQAALSAIQDKNNAETRSESLVTQLADAKQTVDQLKGAVTKATEKLAELTNVIQQDKDYRDQLSRQMQEAVDSKIAFEQRLQAETQNRARLEVAVADLSEQVQGLTAQLGDAQKKVRDTEFLLNKFRETYGEMVNTSKGAEGKVLEVKGNIVVISVGSDDGVANGDTYQIRRGSSYVGELRITRVQKDLAVGLFDTQYTGSGGMPQVGDVAYVSNP